MLALLGLLEPAAPFGRTHGDEGPPLPVGHWIGNTVVLEGNGALHYHDLAAGVGGGLAGRLRQVAGGSHDRLVVVQGDGAEDDVV